MRPFVLLAAATLTVCAGQASAQTAEVGYPEGSLAYRAIASGDYGKAERQLLKEVRIPKDDPARLINHGQVLAKTGRLAEAARLFERAIESEEVELILADGRIMSSREAARRALMSVSASGPQAN